MELGNNLPDEWRVAPLEGVVIPSGLIRGPFGGALKKEVFISSGYKVYTQQNAIYQNTELGQYFIGANKFRELSRFSVRPRDCIVSCSGTIGKLHELPDDCAGGVINQALMIIRTDDHKIDRSYFKHFFRSNGFQSQIIDSTQGGAMKNLVGMNEFKKSTFILPKLKEQQAIAEVLSNADALIATLEKLIEKKTLLARVLRRHLIPESLDDINRDNFDEVTIEEIADCLDNQRIPLNNIQRSKISGDIPYCGANGILDYINKHIFDENIILLAEDGGHFDEFDIRPIAYQMTGKCWVNNHAHILRVKQPILHDYIFHTLVHKDISTFLASGTRAKLNKSELLKITIFVPKNADEANRIGLILNDANNEITHLRGELKKAKLVKAGMIQKLLTGRIRLI